jgi:hypothetical protein
MGKLNKIPLVSLQTYDKLQEPLPDNYDTTQDVIVSNVCVKALMDEGHIGGIYSPDSDTDSVVRNEDGQIIGVKRLEVYQQSFNLSIETNKINMNLFNHRPHRNFYSWIVHILQLEHYSYLSWKY